MAAVSIISEEVLSSKKYPLKYITFEKPDSEGVMQQQAKEVYYRPDAVAVLIVDEERMKFLLCRQFRLPTFVNGNETGYLVEVCAGLMDENETPEQTVLREAKEETGYTLAELSPVAGTYTSAGGITEFVHLFIGSCSLNGDNPGAGGLKDEGEDIELLELGFEEARTMLKQGEFHDMKTILLLQHYFMQLEY